MKRFAFMLSLVIHLGFFFLLLKSSSVPSPEPEIVEITFAAPAGQKEEIQEEVKVIPKGDIDALGKKCEKTYGGIGIQSGLFESITYVFEGYSADRAGLKVGDQVVSKGEIRGEPGTTIHIKIIRKGINIDFTIIREKICYD